MKKNICLLFLLLFSISAQVLASNAFLEFDQKVQERLKQLLDEKKVECVNESDLQEFREPNLEYYTIPRLTQIDVCKNKAEVYCFKDSLDWKCVTGDEDTVGIDRRIDDAISMACKSSRKNEKLFVQSEIPSNSKVVKSFKCRNEEVISCHKIGHLRSFWKCHSPKRIESSTKRHSYLSAHTMCLNLE